MSPELEKKLVDSYPGLFEQFTTKSSFINNFTRECIVEIDDSHFELINDLCEKSKDLSDLSDYKIQFSQIKDKFGQLRVYYDVVPKTVINKKLLSNDQLWAIKREYSYVSSVMKLYVDEAEINYRNRS